MKWILLLSRRQLESLLRDLMSEVKYLRDRVEILPTGPTQGVSTGLQTSHDFQEPSSQSSFSVEDMEVIEQTELPCFPQVSVPVQPFETSTSANLQVSEMAYFGVHIRKHVLPPTAGEPLLEPAQIYVIWCTGSAEAGRPSSCS
jgi:hypothetical protein